MRDLLKNPAWQASDLGQALPDSDHAVSVAMPLVEHVHGYEKGNPEIIDKLKVGYPRFLIHHEVKKYFEQVLRDFGQPGEECFCFPTKGAAARAEEYLSTKAEEKAVYRTRQLDDGLVALFFPEKFSETAKEYWQHTGEIVSSRQVEFKSPPSAEELERAEILVKDRIRRFFDGKNEVPVHISPSGMASFYNALRLVTDEFKKSRVVQIGFPYVDSLKLIEKFCLEHHLFSGIGSGRETEAGDYQKFEELCLSGKVDAVFVEFPTNASLSVPDLERISEICRQVNIPLVVDDTIGSFMNLKLDSFADIVVSSLTKYFSGAGDVLAGSLVLVPESPFFKNLHQSFKEMDKCDLSVWDLLKLSENSAYYVENLNTMQKNAQKLVEFLIKHPGVEQVLYPSLEGRQNYDRLRRPDGGYGALFSIILNGDTDAFFDSLPFSKGPSLGTVFTLACPYPLLAHYHELDWAESCGVSRDLIRVSVGKEDYRVLEEGFSQALGESKAELV